MKTVLVCDCIRDDGKPDPSCRSYAQCFAASERRDRSLSDPGDEQADKMEAELEYGPSIPELLADEAR